MCMCAGISALHRMRGWGLSFPCDADPGFPKNRAFTRPRQPQTPKSLLFPDWDHPLRLSGSFPLGQSCSRRLGSVFWALTSIRNVWSRPCGKHRWMEIQVLFFPSPGMSELHGRVWQGSLFFQKSPCKPPSSCFLGWCCWGTSA